MPKCPKCQKEVYFAERVTSLGKDWHRPCLKCEKCGKTLSAGSHAEHEGNLTATIPATQHSLDPKDLGVEVPKPHIQIDPRIGYPLENERRETDRKQCPSHL